VLCGNGANSVDLQQLWTAGGDERQASFAGQRLGQHGFAGARLPVQQHAAR